MKGRQLQLLAYSLFGDRVVKSRSTSAELVILCPFESCQDKTGNRSVNLHTGATNCWRCGKAYRSFGKFCQAIGYEVDDDLVEVGTSISETEQMLKDLDGEKVLTPVTADIKLPRGFTPVKEATGSVYTRLIEQMAVKKNLSLHDFIQAGVGFTREDPRWERYAIFPIVEWGRLVYYQGRLYKPEQGEKTTKQFPSRSKHPLGSKYWVYNIDEARDPAIRTVVVVESILNVLSLRNKFQQEGVRRAVPVCVFKHALSQPQQLKLLSCHHVQEIVLMFDADATNSAWKSAEFMVNKKKVTVAAMPQIEGREKLDANDDVDLAFEAFENRQAFTPATNLLNLLSAL